FVDYNSEFVGILKLWKAYQDAHEELTQSQLRKWCEKNFLGFLRMREWRELHRQLKLLVQELGWSIETGGSSPRTPSSPRTRGSMDSSVRDGRVAAESASTVDGPADVSSDVRLSAAAYPIHPRPILTGLPTQLAHRIPPSGKPAVGRKPGERRPPAEYEGPR